MINRRDRASDSLHARVYFRKGRMQDLLKGYRPTHWWSEFKKTTAKGEAPTKLESGDEVPGADHVCFYDRQRCLYIWHVFLSISASLTARPKTRQRSSSGGLDAPACGVNDIRTYQRAAESAVGIQSRPRTRMIRRDWLTSVRLSLRRRSIRYSLACHPSAGLGYRGWWRWWRRWWWGGCVSHRRCLKAAPVNLIFILFNRGKRSIRRAFLVSRRQNVGCTRIDKH